MVKDKQKNKRRCKNQFFILLFICFFIFSFNFVSANLFDFFFGKTEKKVAIATPSQTSSYISPTPIITYKVINKTGIEANFDVDIKRKSNTEVQVCLSTDKSSFELVPLPMIIPIKDSRDALITTMSKQTETEQIDDLFITTTKYCTTLNPKIYPYVKVGSSTIVLNSTTDWAGGYVVTINLNITNYTSLTNAIFNWNGTNYTMYNNSLILMMNFDNYTRISDTSIYKFNASTSLYTTSCPTDDGSCAWNDGKVGNALRFDSNVGNYISVPYSQMYNFTGKTFSVSAWFKKTGTPTAHVVTQQGISNANTGWRIEAGSSSGGCYIFNGVAGQQKYSSFSITQEEWVHVVCVWNGTDFVAYKNGVKSNPYGPAWTNYQDSKDPIRIGTYTGTTLPFNGTIDEVKIWNRTLTDNEILNIYNNESAGYIEEGMNRTGLLLELNLNETTGRYARNNANNNNTAGTLYKYIRPKFNITDGKYNGAYEFDGVDDYVSFGTLNNENFTEFTISMWIKPSAYQNWANPRILYKGSDHRQVYYSNSTKTARVEVGNGTVSYYTATGTLSTDKWNFIAFTYSFSGDKKARAYTNGVLSNTQATANTNLNNIANGILYLAYHSVANYYLNASIDELRIWNRSLSADEIRQQYYSNLYKYDADKWALYVNQSNLTTGSYSYLGCAKDVAGNENCTETRVLDVHLNDAPNITFILLNSTDGTNRTKQDLHCVFDIFDINNNTMNASVRWYKGDVLNLTIDYSNNFANGTRVDAVLGFGNTTKGDVWKCSARVFDGTDYSAWVNSSSLTILNTPPTITLTNPENNNITTNRTPSFTWIGNDDDGDSLTYEFNMSLVASSTCSEPDRYVQDILNSNYTLTSEIKCFIDNGDYYVWSARAYDESVFGDWAQYRNISLASLLSTILLVDKVEFGEIKYLGSNDTTTNSPLPFLIQNNGNSFINITIEATDLWSRVSNPSQHYKFKADNSTETGAFDWAKSTTTFTNMPPVGSGQICIAALNYSDATDSAEIDIYVSVPPMESSGTRNSTVTFTAIFAE